MILPILTISFFSLQAQAVREEKEIDEILKDQDASWIKGDAVAYSRSFASGGTFTNIRGEFYTGRKAFEDKHAEIFQTIFKGTTLTQNVQSIIFLKPDVAVVETIAWVSGFRAPPPGLVLDANGRLVTRLLQVLMKDQGEWQIYSYHNVAVGPGGPPMDHK